MEVDALKSSGTKHVGDKPPVTQTDDHMLYQLRYRPEEAKFSSTARVGDCCYGLTSRTCFDLE